MSGVQRRKLYWKNKRKFLRQVQQLFNVDGHNHVAPAAFCLEKMTDEQSTSNNNNNTNKKSSSNKKNNNNNKNSSNNNNISNSNINNNSNNNDHNTSNNTNNNVHSERIIAEAAKILFKNGLNVTNAAAAATLLTAAATFQLPAIPPPLYPVPIGATINNNNNHIPSISSSSSSSSTTSKFATESIGITTETTPATLTTNGLLPSATKQHTASAEPPNPASLPSSSPSSSASSHAMATVTAANAIVATAPKTNIGVIDYTLNSVIGGTVATSASAAKSVNSLQKYPVGGSNHHHHQQQHFDTGRQPITNSSGTNSYGGGRLQFFKDGKFILELARSKDGEKGGWVSVPRKPFRAPSAATSATVTPTSAAPTPTYPKNENSTSLSFSDDNSSIQSSPWQRDHSWKQLRPRRGISKEMTLFYQRPKNIVLTKSGLKTAAKKRRKPYENTKTVVLESFECLDKPKVAEDAAAETMICKGKDDEVKLSKTEIKLDSEKKEGHETNNQTEDKLKVKEENDISRNDDTCTDGVVTTDKVPVELQKTQEREEEVEKDELKLTSSGERKSNKSKKGVNDDENKKEVDDNVVEKMNTNEDDDADEDAMSSVTMDDEQELKQVDKSTTLAENGDTDEVHCGNSITSSKTTTKESCVMTPDKKKKQDPSISVSSSSSSNCCLVVKEEIKAESVNKRLNKKPKTRAKLSTIIQKLIDTVPARLEQLSKTPVVNTMSGNGGTATNSLNHHSLAGHKVSPPSSAATRLVEYHQQHVSPRKRILRELEKVSLEDNHVNNGSSGSGAGGKRSRAKANSSIIGTTPKSSPSRSSASPMLTPSVATLAASYTAGSIGSSNHLTGTAGTTQTSLTGTAATQPPPPPKRLNSSYSIHSLLGGSSSGSSSSSSSSRKIYDQPATIISNVPQQHQGLHTNSLYQHQRSLLTSPKSPEAGNIGGGKSPSHASSSKKRSPPYVATNSPIHHHHNDAHSRSPHSSAVALGHDFGRRTPPDTYKLPLSHQPHPMHQTFYPPYALSSPQFVPSPGVAHSPPMSSTRIPLTSSSSSSTLLSSSSSSTTSHIITPHIPHAASLATRDLSPPRSSTASPREPVTTPRTVPKKTASIRREFASPTASSSSTTTSCPSPGDRSHNAASPERRTNSTSQHNAVAVGNSTPQHLHHHLQQQRSSPTTAAHAAAAAAVAAAAVGSPLHYYMYPPQSNGATSPHGSSSSASSTIPTSHAATTNNNAAAVAAAAAAAAAYIPSAVSPSLYHPYISTLAALRHNPLWLHHYQAASTPLMPSTHHPFAAYNGVGAAAVAAAAAAAAFGQPPATHLPQSAALLTPHGSSIPPTPVPLQQHSSTSAAALQSLQHTTPPPTHHLQQQQQHHHHHHQQHHHMSSVGAERRNHAHKLTDINTTTAAAAVALPPTPTSLTSTGGSRNLYSPASSTGSGSTAHYHSMRDEQSSDVPLNLSKH